MLICETYVIVTLTVTALWVYFGRNWSFRTLALAAFFPALFAPWFIEDSNQLSRIVGKKSMAAEIAVHSIIGGVCAILQLVTITFVSELLGWGKIVDRHGENIEGVPDIPKGFLRAVGEEIGWRSFLLPCLLAHYGLFPSLLISGVVWGLFRVPVVILQTTRLKAPMPYLTVFVQFLFCVLAAFPYGWIAIKSGFSFWAPATMQFTWNRLYPVATGSIYLQTPGKVRGPLWLVNAEGVAGCIIMLVSAVLTLCHLHNEHIVMH